MYYEFSKKEEKFGVSTREFKRLSQILKHHHVYHTKISYFDSPADKSNVTETYPVTKIAPNIPCVHKLHFKNSVNNDWTTQIYEYKNGKTHVLGKGFLGYSEISIYQNVSEDHSSSQTNYMRLINTSKYSYNNELNYPMLTQENSQFAASIYPYSGLTESITNYSYNSAIPVHAPKQIDPISPAEAIPLQTITYTPFKKAKNIKQGDELFQTNFNELIISYGIDNERRKTIETKTENGNITATRTKFFGSF